MTINIRLNGRDVVKRLLQYAQLTFDWKLQNSDIELATELLWENFKLKKQGIPENIRNNTLFSKKNKDLMVKNLNFTDSIIANGLSRLRKIDIVKGTELTGIFSKIDYDKSPLTLNIVFNDTEGK